MKKILVILLSLLMVFSLVACGNSNKGGDVKEEDLKTYEFLELVAKLPEGEVQESDTFDAFYFNDYMLFTAVKEGKDLFAEANIDFDSTTLEDYAKMVEETNGLPEPFELNNAGIYQAYYTSTQEGTTFFYYTFVLLNEDDAFWACTFACLDSEYEKYYDAFVKYATMIEFK